MRALNLPNPGGPLIALIVLGVIAGFAGYATAGDDSTPAPEAVANTPTAIRGIVQSSTANSLTLTTPDGVSTFELEPGTTIEVLQPIELPALRAGDWLNAGAVPNAQTLFALTGLIVIPADLVQAPAP